MNSLPQHRDPVLPPRHQLQRPYPMGSRPILDGRFVRDHPGVAHPGPERLKALAVCVRNCSVYHCSGNRSLTFAARFESLGFASRERKRAVVLALRIIRILHAALH